MSKIDWKQAIKIAQGYICPACGSLCNDYTMNIHHMIPKCRGGASNESNCVAVCVECHRKYHERYGIAISDRYLVPIEDISTVRYHSKRKRRKSRHRKTK